MKRSKNLLLPEGAIKVNLPALSGYSPQRLRKRSALLTQLSLTNTHQIPGGSISVPAPDLPQPTDYSCALAAASIARMYGVGPDSMEEFMQGMNTGVNGTSPANIVRYLNRLGLRANIQRRMTREMLMNLLDKQISTVLDIQAWAKDRSVYADTNKNDNGHYVAAIGYSQEAPQLLAADGSRKTLGTDSRETYFYFMDPSILCRYGFLPWSELDRRWHDDEGTEDKPKPNWHMGIVIRPNGQKPVHASMAEFIA